MCTSVKWNNNSIMIVQQNMSPKSVICLYHIQFHKACLAFIWKWMKSVQVTLMLTWHWCKMMNTNIQMICKSFVPYPRSTFLRYRHDYDWMIYINRKFESDVTGEEIEDLPEAELKDFREVLKKVSFVKNSNLHHSPNKLFSLRNQ